MAAAPTVAHACAHDVTRGHARLFAASIRHPCALSRRFPRSLAPFPDMLGVYTPPCAFCAREPRAPIAAMPAIRLFGIGRASSGYVIGWCAGVRLGGMVAVVRLCFGDPSRGEGRGVDWSERSRACACACACMRGCGRRSMTLRRDFFWGGALAIQPPHHHPLSPSSSPPLETADGGGGRGYGKRRRGGLAWSVPELWRRICHFRGVTEMGVSSARRVRGADGEQSVRGRLGGGCRRGGETGRTGLFRRRKRVPEWGREATRR